MTTTLVNFDNKTEAPYLRGKLQFLTILSFPYLASKLDNNLLPLEIRLSIVVFLFCYTLNLAGCTLLHNNQRYRYRSVYKRIDIASIFLLIAVDGFPIQVYYMKNDPFMAILTSFQWILTFGGVFGALVFDFCCISKNIRSLIHFIITFPNLYLFYKMNKTGDMAGNKCLGAIYALSFIGTIIYCKERPNLILGMFEHHELFHIICILCYYFVVILNKIVVFDKFK